MVKNGDVERLRSPRQFSRRVAIGVAGSGIAARMVVSQDQCRRPIVSGVEYDVSHGHADRFRFAVVKLDMEAASGIVDMGNPKPFAEAYIRQKTGREEAAGGLVTVK